MGGHDHTYFGTVDPIFRSAQELPEASAIHFLPEPNADAVTWTYSDLASRTAQAANLFKSMGIQGGKSVAVLSPSIPEAVSCIWGASLAGVAAPINFLLNTDSIASILVAGEVEVVVAFGPTENLDIWQKATAAAEQAGVQKVLTIGPRTPDAPALEVLLDEQPNNLTTVDIEPRSIACYFHTGGTTSTPKLAALTHQSISASTAGAHGVYQAGKGDLMINGMPLFHVAGSILSTLGIFAGAGAILLPTAAGLRNPDVIKNHWSIAAKHRVTHIGGIPTSLIALLDTEINGADTTNIRSAFTGGAPMPVAASEAFEDKFGIPVREIYGMTETSGLIAATPLDKAPVHGSLVAILPDMEVEVRNLSATNEHSSEGAIFVRGPNVFAGYKDGSTIRSVLESGNWLATGDIGELDENGTLTITGRVKDLIIRSGHNIDPSMIESVADAHPDIRLSAAVGAPDAYAGELPVLFVTLREGADINEDQLSVWLQERIAERPAWPKKIHLTTDWPVTAVGKTFRPELRRRATQDVFVQICDGFRHEDPHLSLQVSLAKSGTPIVKIECRSTTICTQIIDRVRDFTIPVEVGVADN